MRTYDDVVIIGAGQAGLAMSRCLSERGIDHVVLERGQVARALAQPALGLAAPADAELDDPPARLPVRRADDPDGFMTARELVAFLERYAALVRRAGPDRHDRPARRRVGRRLPRDTDRGDWWPPIGRGRDRILRSPARPGRRPRGCRRGRRRSCPRDYRRPGQLPPGGVLVVGASATGVQLADEIQRVRPRRSRWPSAVTRGCRGVIAAATSCGGSISSACSPRRRPTRSDLDALAPSAVAAAGRAARSRALDLAVLPRAAFGWSAGCTTSTAIASASPTTSSATTAAADIKMADVLGRIDRFIAAHRHRRPRRRAVRTDLAAVARRRPAELDLSASGINTVIWATGYRRAYPWLQCPCSTRAAKSSTTAASHRRPGSTCSACSSSGGATRASSTASATTRGVIAGQIAGRSGRAARGMTEAGHA